jgi:hypothetical protein
MPRSVGRESVSGSRASATPNVRLDSGKEAFEQISDLRPEGGVDPVQKGVAVLPLAARSGVSAVLSVEESQEKATVPEVRSPMRRAVDPLYAEVGIMRDPAAREPRRSSGYKVRLAHPTGGLKPGDSPFNIAPMTTEDRSSRVCSQSGTRPLTNESAYVACQQ